MRGLGLILFGCLLVLGPSSARAEVCGGLCQESVRKCSADCRFVHRRSWRDRQVCLDRCTARDTGCRNQCRSVAPSRPGGQTEATAKGASSANEALRRRSPPRPVADKARLYVKQPLPKPPQPKVSPVKAPPPKLSPLKGPPVDQEKGRKP